MPETHKTIKFGTPEWREFMAKRNVSKSPLAAVSASVAPTTIPIASSEAGTPAAGIAAAIVAAIPPETFKSAPAPVPTNPQDTTEMEIQDADAYAPKSPDLWDCTSKEIARIRDFDAKSSLPPSSILLSGSGPSFYSTRTYPGFDGHLRAWGNGEVRRKPNWGADSRSASEPIQYRLEEAVTLQQPPQNHEEPIHCNKPTKLHKEATQHPESLPNPQLVLLSQKPIQDREYPVQHDDQPTQSYRTPRYKPYQPVHLRYRSTYDAINHGQPALPIPPQYRERELRDEFVIRGIPAPSTDDRRELADSLWDNDKEWRQELLNLEWGVLRKLWNEAEVNGFVFDTDFEYFDYDNLKYEIVEHTPGAQNRADLREEFRRLEHAELNTLLSTAEAERVPIDRNKYRYAKEVAHAIAEYRAQQIAIDVAAEQAVVEENYKSPERDRVVSPQHGAVSEICSFQSAQGMDQPQSLGWKRQRDEEHSIEVIIKKLKVNAGSVEKAAASVQIEATAERRLKQSASTVQLAAGIKSGSLMEALTSGDPLTIVNNLQTKFKRKQAEEAARQRSRASGHRRVPDKTKVAGQQPITKAHGASKGNSSSITDGSPQAHLTHDNNSGAVKRKSSEKYVYYDVDDFVVPDEDEEPVHHAKKKRRVSNDEGLTRAQVRQSRLFKD